MLHHHVLTETSIQDTNYSANKRTHREFNNKCFNNPFNFACGIGDHLWFENDLKTFAPQYQLPYTEFPGIDLSNIWHVL